MSIQKEKESYSSITSREYKLMLDVRNFGDLQQNVNHFWQMVMFQAQKQGGTILEAEQNEILKRQTWYLDTPNFNLRTCHRFVLRLREKKGKTIKGISQKIGKRRYTITLKYRDRNRAESAQKDVSVSADIKSRIKNKHIKTKFEEDVLPLTRKFARSTSVSVKQKELPDFSDMSRVSAYFSGLNALNLPGNMSIKKVNNFTAYEVAYRVGKIDFGGTINACLTFWYTSKNQKGPPLAAEFSFDYDREIKGKEYFNPRMVKATNSLFKALQKSDWVDLEATTKTACAYDWKCIKYREFVGRNGS